MCELLPPISEDMVTLEEQAINSAKVEQLMMTMLDEKDKLMDDLQKAKEDHDKVNRMLAESQAEKEALIRQLQILLPQVCMRATVVIIIVYNHMLTGNIIDICE